MSAAPDRAIAVGVLLMAAGSMLLPVMDGLAKYLSAEMSALQVAWGRQMVQSLIMMPLVIGFHGASALVARPIGQQTLRGLIMALANVLFFAAISVMPIADALAIFFVAPLIVTGLSAIFLKEQVGPLRWAAVIVGLIGSILIIRPGSGVFGPVAILPLICAFLFSTYLLLTRTMSSNTPPMPMHFWTAFSGFAVFSVLLIGTETTTDWDWFIAPNLFQWGVIIAIGALSTAGHWMIIQAFRRAPASVLAPLTYTEIIGAVAIGWYGFGDFPDFWTWAGITIIVASGLFVWLRERALANRPGGVGGG